MMSVDFCSDDLYNLIFHELEFICVFESTNLLFVTLGVPEFRTYMFRIMMSFWLPKQGKDKRKIKKNYHPLSLINVDKSILNKILAN